MIEISEGSQEDLTGLRELFLRVRQNTFSWLDTSAFNLLDFDKETIGEYILVAKDGRDPVGFISIWIADNFIHHLFVDEQHQGEGVGTMLINEAIERINFPIRLKCLESNIKAINFYKKNGFAEIGKGMSEEGAYIVFEMAEERA
jgi:GNAT superfamily N-acetyltransferase